MNLPQPLQRHWRGAHEFWRRMRLKSADARIAQTAGSLTFTTLLSLVPLVTIVLMLMTRFSQFSSLSNGLRSFMLENLLPDRAGKVIATYALEFSQKASNLTLLGIAMLVVTAVMLLQTVDRTLNSIWGIRHPRSWWVRMPTYWLVLTLGPFALAAGLSAMATLVNKSLGMVDEPHWINSLAHALVPALMLCGLFTYLFQKVPNRPMVLWHSLAGGLVATIGVILVQRLFGLYLSKLPNFKLIYGTFSVLPIFLVWLYFTWVMVLSGAIVAAVLPEYQLRHTLLPETSSGRIHAALRLIVALAEGQRDGRAQSLVELAGASGQSLVGVEQMLEDMQQAGWAVRTEAGCWVLCTSAHTLKLGEVIAWLALGGGPEPDADIQANRVIRAALERVRAALDTPVAALLQNPAQSG